MIPVFELYNKWSMLLLHLASFTQQYVFTVLL